MLSGIEGKETSNIGRGGDEAGNRVLFTLSPLLFCCLACLLAVALGGLEKDLITALAALSARF